MPPSGLQALEVYTWAPGIELDRLVFKVADAPSRHIQRVVNLIICSSVEFKRPDERSVLKMAALSKLRIYLQCTCCGADPSDNGSNSVLGIEALRSAEPVPTSDITPSH